MVSHPMAAINTDVSAIKLSSTMIVRQWEQHGQGETGYATYQGEAHPPFGQHLSKSSGSLRRNLFSGCFSHFTGSPSYRWLLAFIDSKKGTHVSFPFLLCMYVSMLPNMIRQSRALDSKTLSRSRAARKPMSPLSLLRVKDTMTISDSSP